MSPAQRPTPRATRRRAGTRRRLTGTGVAAVAALALTATSAVGPSVVVPAAVAAPASTSSLTVRVDPAACAAPQSDRTVRVVCSPAEAVPLLIDGSTLELSGAPHTGPLDLRGRAGVTVRGLPGAVLDAGGARYALSVRDARDVRVEGLTLRGGTAQTVWVERTSHVSLRDVTVERSAGAGLQLRDSSGFSLVDARVRDAAGAGVMELTGVTDSSYLRLAVTGNGHGSAQYNGDGLQLAGTRVRVRDVVTTGNGSSPMFEHGVYVAARARDVRLSGVSSSGNSGVAVKLGGSGSLVGSALADDRIALYVGTTAGAGWSVRTTTLSAPTPRHVEPGARLRG